MKGIWRISYYETAFLKYLEKLRTEKGLSQQTLADKMYVTRSTVVRRETGSRLPDAAMITRLSEVLSVDVNILLSAAAQSDEYPNVILVDDRKLILTGGLPVLEEVMPNANVTGFTDANEAIEYAKSNRLVLAFLDIELRDTTGLELCRKLLRINPRTNIVYLTAYSDYSLDAWSTGASVMVLQMRPHFIYNTMMGIYYLCDQDPAKAKQVTLDFTTYLRKNFAAIASEDTISFRDELEHTRAYLAVEQAQFEDTLFVSFDTPHVMCSGKLTITQRKSGGISVRVMIPRTDK